MVSRDGGRGADSRLLDAMGEASWGVGRKAASR